MLIKLKQIIWDTYIELLCFISVFVRCVSTVHSRRVVFIANEGKLYGCNPKYITEELLKYDIDRNYEIIWVLNHAIEDHPCIKTVKFQSLAYIWSINTAGFVFNNFRTDFKKFLWKKRKNQKYVMTWHGSMPLKKIEGDANKLYPQSQYMMMARKDSACCDLMLSSSSFTTKLIRGGMVYSGEVMENGIPRNDIFMNEVSIKRIKNKVCDKLNITDETVVLYAPTFRKGGDLSCYNIDWKKIMPALKKKFANEKLIVLLRLHPDLNTAFDIDNIYGREILDVSNYDDMQELMCASDVLITDYSSTMFEFALMQRPCFLYVNDYKTYDRGFYFPLDSLPFPQAIDNQDLIKKIIDFDLKEYNDRLDCFMKNEIGISETGHSGKSVVEWMALQN